MQLKNILDICADNEIEKFEYTLLKGSVLIQMLPVLHQIQEK